MNNPAWSLPWHLLSSIPCLIGSRVGGCGDTSGSDNPPGSISLIEKLLEIRDLGKLKEILAPDQEAAADGNTPFILEVRKIGECFGRRWYDWQAPWPRRLPLRIRQIHARDVRTDVAITPHAYVLPWPFPGPGGIELAARLPEGFISYDTDIDMSQGIVLDDYMKAVDVMVDPDPDHEPSKRCEFQKVRHTAAKKMIEDDAKGRRPSPLTYPESLQVTVHDWLPTTSTHMAGYVDHPLFKDHLHLQLGWQFIEHQSGCERIDQWPCGAFDHSARNLLQTP